jgi:hypothetical protein
MEVESTVAWSVPAKDCVLRGIAFDSRNFLCMVGVAIW